MKKEIILTLNLLALSSFPINTLGYGNEVKAPFIINLNNNTSRNNSNKKKKFKSFDEFFKKFDKERKVKEVKEKKIQLEKVKKEITKTHKEDKYDQEFILTFYTALPQENSGFGKKVVTCQGKKLRDGVVANNTLPLGTKIKLKGYGTVEILDRGGKNFNSPNRLDVYVPREHGESNSAYYKRVNNMGKVKVQGYIINLAR